MKKLFIVFILISFIGKSQVKIAWNETNSWYDTLQNKRVERVILRDSVIVGPFYQSFIDDVYRDTALYRFIILNTNPNIFSSLLDALNNNKPISTINYLLTLAMIPFTEDLKIRFNGYCTKNFLATKIK